MLMYVFAVLVVNSVYVKSLVMCIHTQQMRRKVSWLVGLYRNVRKTFTILLFLANTTFHVFIGMPLFVLWKHKFLTTYFLTIVFSFDVSFK